MPSLLKGVSGGQGDTLCLSRAGGKLLPITHSPDPAHVRHGCSPSHKGVVTADKCITSPRPPFPRKNHLWLQLHVSQSASHPPCAMGSWHMLLVPGAVLGAGQGQGTGICNSGHQGGPTKGHAHSAGDPQGPGVPWEEEMVLLWDRDSPQRLLE